LILSRLPVTAELTLLSMLIGSAIRVSMGIVAAVWRNIVPGRCRAHRIPVWV
jgi:ABC-type dipeptide/oligopeptide/nickel transport system permease component